MRPDRMLVRAGETRACRCPAERAYFELLRDCAEPAAARARIAVLRRGEREIGLAGTAAPGAFRRAFALCGGRAEGDYDVHADRRGRRWQAGDATGDRYRRTAEGQDHRGAGERARGEGGRSGEHLLEGAEREGHGDALDRTA